MWILLSFLRGGQVLKFLRTDLVIAGPDLYQRIYISIITIDQEVGVYFSVWFPFRCPHKRLTRKLDPLLLGMSLGNVDLKFTD